MIAWIYQKNQHVLARQAFIQLCAGIITFIAFVSIESIVYRFVCIGVFLLCATMQKKRIRIWYFVMLLIAVLISHVFIPNGTVLFYIFSFPVTLGAITQGLLRGQTFVAMVFFSLSSIHPSLRLPGTFGTTLLQVFVYFEMLIKKHKAIRITTIKNIGKKLSTDAYDILHAEHTDQNTFTVHPFSSLFCIVWVLVFGLIFILDRIPV